MFSRFRRGFGLSLKESFDSFVVQSKRVIAITHKPSQAEYRQMSLTTAIGMIIIGVAGLAISTIALLFKGKF